MVRPPASRNRAHLGRPRSPRRRARRLSCTANGFARTAAMSAGSSGGHASRPAAPPPRPPPPARRTSTTRSMKRCSWALVDPEVGRGHRAEHGLDDRPAGSRVRSGCRAAPCARRRSHAAVTRLVHRRGSARSARSVSSRIDARTRLRRARNSGVACSSNARGRGRSTATSSLIVPGRFVITDDAVGDVDRLLHVVRHEEDGEPVRLPDPGEQLLHEQPGLRVERPERLVHQQDPRPVAERPGDGHALLHAARQLVRIGVARTPPSPTRARCSSARSPALLRGSAARPRARTRRSRGRSARGTGCTSGRPRRGRDPAP